jgi:hypothetical protein
MATRPEVLEVLDMVFKVRKTPDSLAMSASAQNWKPSVN